MGIFEEIGVKRTINAAFCLTDLGGSILSKEVKDAFMEANNGFVEMKDLHKAAGRIIAGITGAEAAHVSSGAFGSLVLSAAACLAGKDPVKMKKLPDTTGMKNEIVIQSNLRNHFDRSMEVPGGKFVVVEPNIKAMRSAIGNKTVAIQYFPQLDPPRTDVIPLNEVISLAHEHGIPVIVDAAGQTYPLDRLQLFTKMGADLVCYSGKYFYGPNSTGFVCGKKELVEAAAENSFVGPFAGWVARAQKLDRQEIVALVVAIRRWVKMDHEKERLQPARKRCDNLVKALNNVPGIKLEPQPYSYHVVGLQVVFENKTYHETLELSEKMREGDPPVRVRSVKDNSMLLNTLFLADGEEYVVADKIKTLSGC